MMGWTLMMGCMYNTMVINIATKSIDTSEGPSPSRWTQSCVFHPLCRVPKCIHWPDRKVSKWAYKWIPMCTEEWGHASIRPGRTHVQDRLCMQWTSANLRWKTNTTTPPWHIQHNQAVLNRDQGTLSEVSAALLDWWTISHTNIILYSLHAEITLYIHLHLHWFCKVFISMWTL